MKKNRKGGMVEKFFHLPEEIILNIISRLPFESVLHCRLVCKIWRNLVRDPSFAQMHLLRHHDDQNVDASSSSVSTSAASSGMMGFIFLSGSAEEGKSFHFLRYYYDKQQHQEHKLKLKTPMDDHLIVGSCNGLVCVSVKTNLVIGDPLYICNPLTREYVILPSVHIKHKDTLITGFGYHPSTNEYKVVRIFRNGNEPNVTSVQVYTLGDCINGWRDKGEIMYEFTRHHRFSLGILANGALHWTSLIWEGDTTKILAFDLVDEKFRVLPPPPFIPYSISYNYFGLCVFKGSLCALHYTKGGCIDVWSFKKKDDNEMNEQHEEYYKHWSWSKEFCSKQEILISNDAVALTENGEVLLYHDHLSLFCYDVKTATSKRLVGIGRHSNLMPHMNSFVSLKALGEKEVIESAAEGTLESEISTPRSLAECCSIGL